MLQYEFLRMLVATIAVQLSSGKQESWEKFHWTVYINIDKCSYPVCYDITNTDLYIYRAFNYAY